MINVTTVVVLDIIVGMVLHICPLEMSDVSTAVNLDIFNVGAHYQGKIGFVDHRIIHLRIGETDSKFSHQTGIVIETTQEGVSPTYRRFTLPRFQNRNRSVSPADLDKNWRDRSSDKDYEYQQPPEVSRRNVSFSGANLNGKRGSPRVGTPPQKQ